MHACWNHSAEVVQLLIDRGANPKECNAQVCVCYVLTTGPTTGVAKCWPSSNRYCRYF
jgi:hypothetical protein